MTNVNNTSNVRAADIQRATISHNQKTGSGGFSGGSIFGDSYKSGGHNDLPNTLHRHNSHDKGDIAKFEAEKAKQEAEAAQLAAQQPQEPSGLQKLLGGVQAVGGVASGVTGLIGGISSLFGGK